MLSNKYVLNSIITLDDFLKQFDGLNLSDIQKGISLDLEFDLGSKSQKLCPIIQLAKPDDAKEIVNMFKDAYNGTYPYKEMEDEKEIQKMIKSKDFHWIIFKINSNIIIGCFGFQIDLEKKSGTFHGLILKKQFQNKVDVTKTAVGCIVAMMSIYQKEILVWSCEIRAGHNKTQYMARFTGLKPIAFFPGKDIFFNYDESDFLYIIYDKNALWKYRCKEPPRIIRQILNNFLYSNERYHLGIPIIENPVFNFSTENLNNIREKIVKKIEKDKFGNEEITFSFKNSDSYFKFLHRCNIKTIENTTYKVSNLDELFIFVQEMKKLIKHMKIRYFECFISSYEPSHQKVFYNAGFKPNGYVFSWKYDIERKVFDDYVVFNYYQGDIYKNIQLLPETLDLLKKLNYFKKNLVVKSV